MPTPRRYAGACTERYECGDQVCDAAVLKAVDLNDEGKRQVLGLSVSLSEQEVGVFIYRPGMD
jgi:hypothetical protein